MQRILTAVVAVTFAGIASAQPSPASDHPLLQQAMENHPALAQRLEQQADAHDLTRITVAQNFHDLGEKFCSLNQNRENIVIVLSDVFTRDSRTLNCPDIGNFTLRLTELRADPGHNRYNIDSPHGVTDALDCDGQADIGMKFVALNCYPVNKETATHLRT